MVGFQDRLRRTSVARNSLAIFWLGGASFVFKTSGGSVVYIDPYLSDSALMAELNPGLVIPMHYGLIPETHSDPYQVVSALKRRGVESEAVVMEFAGEYMFRRTG